MIPIDSALKLYLGSPCDKHNNYWLSLKWKAITLKQDSLLISNPKSPKIKTCSECGIRFEDSNDWIGHMSDDHGIIAI